MTSPIHPLEHEVALYFMKRTPARWDIPFDDWYETKSSYNKLVKMNGFEGQLNISIFDPPTCLSQGCINLIQVLQRISLPSFFQNGQ